MINDCLWIWLNCSNYNFALTIIDFLTIVWLFFTWFQLIKPIHKLRLSYYSFFRYQILFFCWIAWLFTLVPIVLKFIPWKAIPIIWYDIFWEILWLVFILVIWIYTFFCAITPIKRVKNIKKLNEIIINCLWQGEKRIEALWQEFWFFIWDIVKKVDENNDDAYRTLLLCKNKKLIESIIINNISSFNELLKVYADRKFTYENDIENLHKDFVKLVINESLSNNDSILSREIKWEIYDGFNSWKWIISQTIFNNFKFIHDYDLLDRDGYRTFRSRWNIQEIYGDNYIEFRRLCVYSFFWRREDMESVEKNRDYYEDLCWGLCKFSWYKWIIYNYINKGNYMCDSMWPINLTLIDKKWEIILRNRAPERNYYKIWIWWFNPIWEPQDFIESISWWCYKCLESVSYIKETDENLDTIRHYCCEIYWDMHDGLVFEAIQKNIRNLIFWQIENVNSKWNYPNMTRIFFHLFGRKIFGTGVTITEDEKDFIIKSLKIISKSLKSFSEWYFRNIKPEDNENLDNDLQNNRKEKARTILEDFLPKNIVYSKEDNTLTSYFAWWIDKSVLNLNELENDKIVLNQNNN